MELLRDAAADIAAVRRHDAKGQAETAEDAVVNRAHVLVTASQAVLVQVEGIGILHQEFAAAQNPEARPDLVSELALDLVQADRQPPVTADFPAGQVRDHFFVRRSQAELALVPVPEAQQLGPVFLPSSGFTPQLSRLHPGHE